MVSLTALWLPIVLSAVMVFIASSILHMVLPFHWKDYKKLPGEDNVREAMRKEAIEQGNYAIPCPTSAKDMGSPEMIERYKQGPVGFVNVLPSGPPAMGKSLVLWFVYCLVLGVLVAYIGTLTLSAGTDYRLVFRVISSVAFLGYAGAQASDSLWKGQNWGTTFKHIVDGLVYALLTAGVFGWLWPS